VHTRHFTVYFTFVDTPSPVRIVPRADRRHVSSRAPSDSSSIFLTPLAFAFLGEGRCTAPTSIMTLQLKTAGRAASGRDSPRRR